MKLTWDDRFLQLAKLVSTWSKDPSTKCGAVIVDNKKRIVSLGFNGFPTGANDSKELYENRDTKYLRVIHAEKNAILFSGRDLTGCALFIWPMPPCAQCAAFIAQSGIRIVVTPTPDKDKLERWKKSFEEAAQILEECGVTLLHFGEVKWLEDRWTKKSKSE